MLGHRNIWLAAATALLAALTATPADGSQPAKARCIAELGQAGELGADVNVKTANFITGTEGHDGYDHDDLTPGNDVICGFGGPDIVADLVGGDVFLGGDGRDAILGYQSGGTFYGGPGDDSVNEYYWGRSVLGLSGGTFYGEEGNDLVRRLQPGGTFYGW